jgi:hypothetical protein
MHWNRQQTTMNDCLINQEFTKCMESVDCRLYSNIGSSRCERDLYDHYHCMDCDAVIDLHTDSCSNCEQTKCKRCIVRYRMSRCVCQKDAELKVIIDFNSASLEWRGNKKRVGQGFEYICGVIRSNGSRCNKSNCRYHATRRQSPMTPRSKNPYR